MGVHTSTWNFVDHRERELGMEERIKASISSWNIGKIYQMPDPTKASKSEVEKVLGAVLLWLSSHFEDTTHPVCTAPPPPLIEKTMKKEEPRDRQRRFQTRSGRRKYRKVRLEDEGEYFH